MLLGVSAAVDVILVFYALMFLLPLLGLPPKALAALSATCVVLGPVLLVAMACVGVSGADPANPTLATAVTDPGGLLVEHFVTGAYPVVVYVAFICSGLAVGRLDLRSRRVAGWLLGSGLALALMTRTMSWVVLHPLDGLDRLTAQPGLSHDDRWATLQLLCTSVQGAS